jgi:hypothetical protein
VTLVLAWVTAAFHALVIFWSPGKVKVSVQPLTGDEPLLAIVTLAVNPPGQLPGV